MSGNTTARDQRREELRTALLACLTVHGGEAATAATVYTIAVVHDADARDVTAAMWTLVDDNLITYGPGTELKLVQPPEPQLLPMPTEAMLELLDSLGVFGQLRMALSPYLGADDVQTAIAMVGAELRGWLKKAGVDDV